MPSLPHIEMTAADAPRRGRGSLGRWVAAAIAVAGARLGGCDLGDFTVEPDLSNAGPFLAAALVTGGSVTIARLAGGPPAGRRRDPGRAHPDGRGRARPGPDGLTVTGSGAINGIEADLRDIPELCLPLTSVAALASGPSAFTGVGHTRAQETDRLAAIAKEINALGGDVTELPDGLSVRPRPLHASPGQAFESYDDHRMVMAAAVLGLAVPGIEVPNVATVGKTFPDFTALWSSMVREESGT